MGGLGFSISKVKQIPWSWRKSNTDMIPTLNHEFSLNATKLQMSHDKVVIVSLMKM